MINILAVVIGGGLGSLARYATSNFMAARYGADFPLGTLAVNIAGCFIIGLFMTLSTERLLINPVWRLVVAVGFLGGLTTFSSFSYETIRLLQHDTARALLNMGLNVVAGLFSTWLGITVARVF